jgi:hypothetical protein
MELESTQIKQAILFQFFSVWYYYLRCSVGRSDISAEKASYLDSHLVAYPSPHVGISIYPILSKKIGPSGC